MKTKLFISIAIMTLATVACQSSANKTKTEPTTAETTSMAQGDTTMAFHCPMHKDKMGKAGDKCPMCDMAMVSSDSTGMSGHQH